MKIYDSIITQDPVKAELYRRNIEDQLCFSPDFIDNYIVIKNHADTVIVNNADKRTATAYHIDVLYDEGAKFPEGFCMDPEFLENYKKGQWETMSATERASTIGDIFLNLFKNH